jgi:hypothetical protein
MFRSCAGLVALSSLLLSGAALAQEKIKVGVTATLEGTYTVLGEDGIRGHQTALNTLGKKVGDKELEFIIASTDATPDSAIRAVRKLIEQDKGPDPALAAVRRRRHRGQELCQDAPRADLRERRFRRAGNHLCRPVAKLLPLQHGRRPVAGRAWQIRV